MKFTALLVQATLLFSTALALSSPAAEAGLEARGGRKKPKPQNPKPAPAPVADPPTDADVLKHYEHIAPSTCLFYAKVGRESDVRKVRDEREYLQGYKILEERWTDRWHLTAKNQMKGGKKGQRRFFEMASRVLAKECAGVVYVLLPEGEGKDWDKTSIWNNEEYPSLADSTKVIRLNMNDASHQETIWDGSGKRAVVVERTAVDGDEYTDDYLDEDEEPLDDFADGSFGDDPPEAGFPEAGVPEGETRKDQASEQETGKEETSKAGTPGTRKAKRATGNASEQCTVHVSQWEHVDAEAAGRFELEVSVQTADDRVLAHQPRVAVADGQPLDGPAPGRLVVIPAGDRLAFSSGARSWGAEDAGRCTLGGWAAAEEEDEDERIRHRDVRCEFAC